MGTETTKDGSGESGKDGDGHNMPRSDVSKDLVVAAKLLLL